MSKVLHRRHPTKRSQVVGMARPRRTGRPANRLQIATVKKTNDLSLVSLAPLYRKNAIHACKLAQNAVDPVETNAFAQIAERWVVLAETEESRLGPRSGP
jgi:hypothetical protein